MTSRYIKWPIVATGLQSPSGVTLTLTSDGTKTESLLIQDSSIQKVCKASTLKDYSQTIPLNKATDGLDIWGGNNYTVQFDGSNKTYKCGGSSRTNMSLTTENIKNIEGLVCSSGSVKWMKPDSNNENLPWVVSVSNDDPTALALYLGKQDSPAGLTCSGNTLLLFILGGQGSEGNKVFAGCDP